jgi:nucleotide-binding universal stress UspA family protein
MYKHILISTDGSELAQRGVDHGLALAKPLGSRVTIMTVTEPLSPAMVGAEFAMIQIDLESYEAQQKGIANGILSAAKAVADKAGVTTDTLHVPSAWPAGAIVETAERLQCDLIVMASHGRRGIRKVLLGSQTTEVLVTTSIPVLVVH